MLPTSIMEPYQKLTSFYAWCLSIADKRVADWPLMSSPMPTLLVTGIYLVFSCYAGPRFMAKRKPYKLQYILVPYNLAMCVLNVYIGLELAWNSTKRGYSYFCQPVDYSDNPHELRIAKALWWYYFSRLIEMLDTVFLVFRKKTRQLSFLHIYHHSTMFCLWWIGIKWVPGGSAFLAAMVNSFIHVLMYLYYALSACGPQISKYLFWKKYLTVLQMLQFTSALILGINAIVKGCDFPLWMQYALVVYMISFLVLFGNFFYKEYLLKRVESATKRNKNAQSYSWTSFYSKMFARKSGGNKKNKKMSNENEARKRK